MQVETRERARRRREGTSDFWSGATDGKSHTAEDCAPAMPGGTYRPNLLSLLYGAATTFIMSSRSATRLLQSSTRWTTGSQGARVGHLTPLLAHLAGPVSSPPALQAPLPLQHLLRPFSTTPRRAATTDPSQSSPPAPTEQPVSLVYELHSPPKDASPNAGGAQSLVVCHGLFGSKQNWRSLAKAMAKQFGVPVYAVDLRNHGTSTEHVEGMSYRDMALDLLQFVKEHQLEKIALVGHSMGGKAVMAFALAPELQEGTLEYLVSVDMSPARGPLSPEFEEYIEAMLAIEKKGCGTRGEADELLKETEPVSGGRGR